MRIRYNVGREVRSAIEKIGGTMPEDLPVPQKKHSRNRKRTNGKIKGKSETQGIVDR